MVFHNFFRSIIAHSAASQRGREGRRKRWGKVCVTIKNLLYFLQEANHHYFQICYTYSQILCFLISWLGKEAYGYSNEGRFDSAGIWTVFCSGHHNKGNEKTYGIEGTYILPVTETGQVFPRKLWKNYWELHFPTNRIDCTSCTSM